MVYCHQCRDIAISLEIRRLWSDLVIWRERREGLLGPGLKGLCELKVGPVPSLCRPGETETWTGPTHFPCMKSTSLQLRLKYEHQIHVHVHLSLIQMQSVTHADSFVWDSYTPHYYPMAFHFGIVTTYFGPVELFASKCAHVLACLSATSFRAPSQWVIFLQTISRKGSSLCSKYLLDRKITSFYQGPVISRFYLFASVTWVNADQRRL